ncbi:LuxR C-terminal-related transcriptional regulator [Mangrovibacterium diazotrophicum]|uniref:PAS domain-containing protein n=1 Tax=Mangrovibacterium diazotrophicum TaxID=1261403 RepID=A0A419VWI3_9BACT|nr:LuxR C-terminal-related transcriptional regulator [Mangrovibacterium diazotrophicum]RKD86468.1 PAS domain-containing protein [Mangrovibacterium diazotrophicum]
MTIDDNLLSIYDEVFQSNSELEHGIIKNHIMKIKEMDEFMPPSLSFFILTNTTLSHFPFVSKNFSLNLGLDPQLMKTVGAEYWLSHFHPEDLPVWIGVLNDLMVFTMTEVEPEKRMHLSYTWNFRVRTAKGNYVNIFEHQSPLLLDDIGKPVIGLGHLTIIGQGEALPIKATVKCLNEEKEYETLYSQNYSQRAISNGLSNRENDIIRFLSMKKTSKEIGNILHISSHTVDTHRRNILKKLNLGSTGELIAYVRSHQLY